MRAANALSAAVVVGLVACSEVLEPTRDSAPVEGARVPGVTDGYRVIPLGSLGGDLGRAQGINDRNQVVGTSRDASGDLRAFLWRNGSMDELPGLGGSFSGANDINNRGVVVGEAETAARDVHAVLWRNGEPVDLGTLSGSFSQALAVNERGLVVGAAENGTGELVPFVASRGRIRELPVPAGTDAAWAFGVNDRGDIVGSAVGEFFLPDFVLQVALLWPRGGDVVVLASPCQESGAFGINNRGHIVGGALTCGPVSTNIIPVLWDALEFTVLEPLGGLTADPDDEHNGMASAVNSRGEVVGWSEAETSSSTATLWFRESPFDIGGEAPVSVANAINERGIAAGSASGSPTMSPQPALFAPSSADERSLEASPRASLHVAMRPTQDPTGALSGRDWARRLCEVRGRVELIGPVTAAAIMAGCP